MRIKRTYLLLIFVFSLFMTNVYYSQSKPPLLEVKNSQNIVILAEKNSNPQEILPLDLSKTDIHLVGTELQRDCVVEILTLLGVVLSIPIFKEKVLKAWEPRGFIGIVLWDRKRVLRN